MTDKKETTRPENGMMDICTKIVKAVFIAIMVFTTVLFFYYCFTDKDGGVEIDDVQFIEQWVVTDGDGRSFHTGRFHIAEKDYDKDFTIESKLPDSVEDNMYLCFATGKNLSVYINGELRKSFDEVKNVNLPGGSVKRFYLLIPLKATDAGGALKIERASTTRRGQIVPESFVGTMGDIYAHLMMNYGLSLMLAEVIQILSLVVIAVSFAMRFSYRRRINMLYGAVGIFVIASWVVTDSLLFPFVFGHYHIDGVVNYLLCLVLPFGPALYLNSIQHARYQKIMNVLFVIASVNAIIWPILHFTGILPFYGALGIINVVQAGEALAGFLIMLTDIKRGYAKEYKYTAVGFLGFIVCAMVEIVYLMFFTLRQEELPMVVGLGFFLTFVVLQQVDDLRKTFAEKQHAIDLSQAKSRFLASMSHEIRTPINAILGMNEMILRENQDATIEEYSAGIKSSGKMLLMLVNDVLDFSKIEAGKLEINEAEFQMSGLLHDVWSLIRERASEKNLALHLEIQEGVPNGFISDGFRIRQILINLLNNAIKYTDQGEITLRLGGEYAGADQFLLHCVVKDTGRGIRREDRADLFEAFSRADIRKNVNIEGTGLGLAIVKSILDSMNGEVGVESEYGVGSEFWFRLPARVSNKEPLTKEAVEKRNKDEGKETACDYVAPDANVLAVDDNQSNLTIARLFLKRTQVKADFCNDGNKAIRLCREKKYDLILLDHMMPSPDGIETFRRIRSDERSLNRNTPVIVLTANAVAGSRQMYLDVGFADYLSKPLDSALLEQTMKKFLPKDKVLETGLAAPRTESIAAVNGNENDEEPLEFLPEEKGKDGKEGKSERKLSERLKEIEGLDYDTLMMHCAADEGVATEILAEISMEGPERCVRMREDLSGQEYSNYGIDAHAVKGLMATIGLSELSERAKRQEFAVKEGNYDLVREDGEGFIAAYEELCGKLSRCLNNR